jgi:hypothetical protein
MQAEPPAEGILKTHDWGTTKTYQVVCGCGYPDHDHRLWVEANDAGVEVTLYTNSKSTFWSMTRFKQIWTLIINGYLEHESTIYMSRQQAINYAETLKSAVKDVETFREK